ncbi:hypothetical protein [Paenibacillus agaridevorans]|nr:hypothetical protein [Paenibacillus agaridevorans]
MKRKSSIVLTMILVFALLVSACGKNEPSNTSGSNASPISSPDSKNNQGSNNEAEAKEATVALKWQGPNYPFEDGTYAQKLMEETFNVSITPVRIDDSQQLNLLLASGDIPDIMYISTSELVGYVKNDVLAGIPLDMVKKFAPDYYDIVVKQDPNVFTYGSLDGTLYGLPRLDAATAPYALSIRGDWLKNVGSDVPKTLEQLEEVFVKFRNNDPDQDGKKNTYAMSMGSDNVHSWFNSIFGAYNTNPFLWLERDGKLQYGFTLNETKEALKLLAKWKSMDLIDPEFITDKSRTSGQDDISYKFSAGRIGYADNISYDDQQWDNDGHLNAKWVAQHPEWQEFFGDPANTYVTEPFYSVPESGPQPVYVNMAPPTGPDGQSGTLVGNLLSRFIVFGKQVANDDEKMERLLTILNTLVSNEDVYVSIEFGAEGKVWEYNDAGQRVMKEGWTESAEYHPQGKNLGTGLFFDLLFATNPDFLSAFGGPRAVQRYEKTKPITNHTGIGNAVKAPLASESKYPDLSAMLQEYIMKAILGEVDIDATYDSTVAKWLSSGGEVLTQEANDWFASTK